MTGSRRRPARSGNYIGPGEPRDLPTYLAALRSRPGARLQLLAILGFGIPVAIKSGLLVALAILVGAVGIGATYGYRRFKRTGRVY